jgi:hypothetical protein
MSDSAHGRGWVESDGRWYPPELWTGTVQTGATRDPGTNRFAIASHVCSCVGILLMGIPRVVGIMLGFVARSRIRQSNGAQPNGALCGDGLAIAGIIVGFVVVGLILLAIVVNATHGRIGQ